MALHIPRAKMGDRIAFDCPGASAQPHSYLQMATRLSATEEAEDRLKS